jgi:hypothetical protein
MRLVSGEDSMTSSEVLEELGLELAVAVEVEVPVELLEVELADEQAARPIPRRPAAATASALLLEIPLTVNFDPFLSVNAVSRRIVIWEG